jgi:hypothetical protein
MGSDEGAKIGDKYLRKGDTYRRYMSPVLVCPHKIEAERGHVLLRYVSPFFVHSSFRSPVALALRWFRVR